MSIIFYPLFFFAKYIVSTRLFLPSVTVLPFIETNIFLPFMALFICIVIYNGKIAAVKNTRVFSVLEFDGDNTGRVFSVIVSILMGYLIQRLCNFEFDFFRSIIAIIVVDLQINIKIIANICLWGVSHHITPSTSHEIKAKSKIIPK